FINHIGINSWFQVIQDASPDFVSDERTVWMDIEGIPLRAWSRETFKKIGKKLGETLDLEDNVDTSFGCKWLCVKTAHPVLISETFKIIVKERVDDDGSDDDDVPETVFGSNTSSPNQDNVTSESRPSLSHPPGSTPEGVVHHEMLGTVNGEADNNGGKDNP
nr:RNA-directed DNA polymerase, eukaryota [Tanacetum cinerariifolium]